MRTKELIIQSPGYELSYKSPFLFCKNGDDEKKIHASTIHSIIMLNHCQLDSSLFDMIYKYSIQCHFSNESHYPLAKLLPMRSSLVVDVYKAQIQFSQNLDFLNTALSYQIEKFEKRGKLLSTYLSHQRDLKLLNEYMLKLQQTSFQLTADLKKSSILITEAHLSKLFWKVFNKCLNKRFRFKNRSKQPANDLTNALLNYGYGITYSIIDKVIVNRGLDPCIGILHETYRHHKSLSYDIIEKYRHHTESVVIEFLNGLSNADKIDTNCHRLEHNLKQEYVDLWNKVADKNQLRKDIGNTVQTLKNQYLEAIKTSKL